MTREEAIIILQESLRQNKAIQESPNTFFRSADIADGMKNAEGRIEALNMAIADLYLYAQQDTPPNDPLTLEQLREMGGEPVWVVELNGYPPRWGLVYWCRKNKRNVVYVTINNGASICAETFISVGGKIYRRKPGGGGG